MRGKLLFPVLLVALSTLSYRLGRRMDFSKGFAGTAFSGAACVPDLGAAAPSSWTGANPARWNDMTARLGQLAGRFPGRIGIYVKDISTGRDWEYHADEVFPSASLIKVPVMIGIFEKLRRNEIDLDDELVLKKGEKRGGSGNLRRLRYGTRLTVRQLVEKMITESDNTATRMLVDHVGLEYLQERFTRMGLKQTGIYPEGLSLSSLPVGRENYTTPREMCMLLEGIYRGQMVDKPSSESMLEIMRRVKTHSRFAKYLPRGWSLAHKTGMLRLACHDVGVISSPTGDYLLAVMTWKVPDYHFAANYISKMSNVTYKYYDYPQNSVAQGRSRRAAKNM